MEQGTTRSEEELDDPIRGLNKPFDRMFAAEMAQWVSKLPKYEEGHQFPSAGHPDPRNELVGLALSGGGMRSGTFSLGVVQALAQYGLMEQVDYMSTVSGGGYCGTSLTGLCAEELPYKGVLASGYPPKLGMRNDRFPFALPNPLGSPAEDADGKSQVIVHGLESPATRHVRERARLIVPSPGLLDTETWTGVTRYLVSTVLLWAVFLLPQITVLFLLTMLVPDSVWSRSSPFTEGWVSENPWVFALPGVLAGIAALLTLWPVGDYHEANKVRRRRSWLVHRVAVKGLLIAMGITGAAVLFMAGLALHIWVLGESAEWVQQGLTLLLAGGAATAISAWRALQALPGRLAQTLAKVVFGVSGYYLLAFGLVAWYWFLWNGWEVIDWEGLVGLGGQFYLALVLSLALIALAWLRGHRLLNGLSLSRLYEQRIQRTWGIAATPGGEREREVFPEYPVPEWTRVWVRPDNTVGRLASNGGPAWQPSSPYPLVCTALNIPGSTGPKLLDRKADSFVIGPVYSGSALTRWKPTDELPTFKDMSLAQAAAVSGAAISPNMGASANATLSILTAVFNVRLGRWVANPRPTTWLRRWLLSPPALYWKEVFGMAKHEDAFVYLSDGGHFDNSGIYELLRRRCKYIIAVDGGGENADDSEKLTFGGIGVPLRMARIDFGVLVDMDLRPLKRDPNTGLVKSYWAVGRIRYPKGDGHGSGDPDDPDSGVLLFIKAGRLDGMTPPDIVHYTRAINKDFPHDSTANQQFDEPQFESYRELGFLAARDACKKADGKGLVEQFSSLDKAYQRLLEELGYAKHTARPSPSRRA